MTDAKHTPRLLPCPCCGGEPLISAVRGWTIQCANCYLRTGHYRIEADAFAAWNRRAPDMAAEIAALRAGLANAYQDAVEACSEIGAALTSKKPEQAMVAWGCCEAIRARALLAAKEEG